MFRTPRQPSPRTAKPGADHTATRERRKCHVGNLRFWCVICGHLTEVTHWQEEFAQGLLENKLTTKKKAGHVTKAAAQVPGLHLRAVAGNVREEFTSALAVSEILSSPRHLSAAIRIHRLVEINPEHPGKIRDRGSKGQKQESSPNRGFGDPPTGHEPERTR